MSVMDLSAILSIATQGGTSDENSCLVGAGMLCRDLFDLGFVLAAGVCSRVLFDLGAVLATRDLSTTLPDLDGVLVTGMISWVVVLGCSLIKQRASATPTTTKRFEIGESVAVH